MTKVLLIEDDPLIYRLYKKLFKLENFEIEVAENGQLGLEKIQTFYPDIILLDVMMPTMNGLEFLTKLKTEDDTKNIPVIVLTNMTDFSVTNMVLSKGAALCIIKSESEPTEVIDSVKAVLAKYAQVDDSDQTQEK